jgi:DNA-binding CsgD family transcriptional regulator
MDGVGYADRGAAERLIRRGARLRAEGRVEEARDALRLALDIAHRCGADDLEERARAELVAAGGRPRRAALSGTAALTPGERRVAELAASGLTNREIANALVVTVKAVQWHLRHVYRKLGISDRAQLHAHLSENGGSAVHDVAAQGES